MSRLRLTRFREKGSSCGLVRVGAESSGAAAAWMVGDALGVLHKTAADSASGPARIQKIVSHGELFEEPILAIASAQGSAEVALGHGHEVSRRQVSLSDAAGGADLGQAFRGTHDITHLQYDSSGKNL